MPLCAGCQEVVARSAAVGAAIGDALLALGINPAATLSLIQSQLQGVVDGMARSTNRVESIEGEDEQTVYALAYVCAVSLRMRYPCVARNDERRRECDWREGSRVH